MIIKEISTDRFAGIHSKTGDNSIKLNPGLNVIYGKNEAGKSTLVNLISRTLFQIKNRKSSPFEESSFPHEDISDTVNGTLKIEKDGEIFTLERTWKKEQTSSHPKLTTLNSGENHTKDDNVQERLKDVLEHGEGVYTELLLSPQKDAADNLKKLLEGTGVSHVEIKELITQALLESGGYSLTKFGSAVNDKIESLKGKYWDTENNRPLEKNGRERYNLAKEDPNPKKKIDKDLVRRAYYALEDAKSALEAQKILSEKSNSKKESEKKLNDFQKYQVQIANNKYVGELESSISTMEEIHENWPEFEKQKEKAEILEQEYNNRIKLDRYTDAEKAKEDLDEAERKWSNVSSPTEDEIKSAENAENTIKNNMRDLNITLSAKIEMLAGHSVIIKSALTGKTLDINAPITEAVIVEIPGIMKMTLAPADVDVDDKKAKIAEAEEIRGGIFDKYKANSIDALKALAAQKRELEQRKKDCSNELDKILNGDDYCALENEALALGNVRKKAEIDRDIADLCGDKTAHDFVVSIGSTLTSYKTAHVSIDALSDKIKDAYTERDNAKKSTGATDNIPEDYYSIDESQLKKELEEAENAKAAAEERFKANLDKLSILYTGRTDNLEETVKECERIFNERKDELSRWLRIQKVYNELKDEIMNNPYEELSKTFCEYLGIISDNKDTSDFEGKELAFTINNSTKYNLLSEGTKETVYLAFRLAVLDHLFPDGGGVIVLDDPLNDMDIDRVKQSCELIKKSAEKHQVILLTCREEYSEPLGVAGKEIRI